MKKTITIRIPLEVKLADFPGISVLQLSWSKHKWHTSFSFLHISCFSASKSLKHPRVKVSSVKFQIDNFLDPALATSIETLLQFCWIAYFA